MLTSAFSTIFFYFIPRTLTILTKGVTSLIPKEDQPTSPAEFRPITVISTILRFFHKILASRLDTIPINNAQKGFRTTDLREHHFKQIADKTSTEGIQTAMHLFTGYQKGIRQRLTRVTPTRYQAQRCASANSQIYSPTLSSSDHNSQKQRQPNPNLLHDGGPSR